MGNLLIHREYAHAFPAKFVIEQGRLFTENSNRPHGHGPIDPAFFSPYPKNPVIARVFKEIGWADELGSGVRKLYRFSKAFGGFDPVMIEGDVFRLTLRFTDNAQASGKPSGKTSGKPSGKTSGEILAAMQRDALITIPELAAEIGVTERSIERNIQKLQEDGRLRRVGPARGGHWEVLE